MADTTNNPNLNWDEKLSEGTDAETNPEEAENTSTDGTNENVGGNDPAKNKKLAEITIAEQLRETYQLKLKIPKIFKKINTNQFFFIELSDQFYETNYPDIISVIADEKYGRFAGFEKGRFFIDKVVEYGGIDGFGTELTINPIPKSLGEYTRKQLEAEKALMEAVLEESSTGNGGGNAMNGSVNATELIAIGNELASMYTFCGEPDCHGCTQSYSEMKRTKCGSCFAWSGALYTELTAKGYQCRVVQYGTESASNHRSVEINQNGQWVDYPYRSTNIPRGARNTDNKNRFVIDEETLRSIC